MRKTKIITTLGPVTESEEAIEKLIAAGVNVFRLNMSHAKREWVKTIAGRIRKKAWEFGRAVGILIDTQGPEIRTGDLPKPLQLHPGDEFTFTVQGFKSDDPYSVDVNYPSLVNDVKVGDVVLIDNGVIRMVAKEKGKKWLKCEVATEGSLGNRRHINLPGIKIKLPSLTEKDKGDIEMCLDLGVDFIALSFVRGGGDPVALKQFLTSKGHEDIRVVAKIEDVSAVENIDDIIATADAVMIARGDLGIECPYEELPIIQRRIVKKCILNRKPVIVATHMLESMITNPMPTRAEITDVANAVFEGADAIMLSGETTVGRYPVECIEVLNRVALRIEQSGSFGYHQEIEDITAKQTIAYSAIALADKVKASGICVFTKSGQMAIFSASMRPRRSPIFAFTPDSALPSRLTLRYGIYAFHLPFEDNPEDNILKAKLRLQQLGLVPSGEDSKLVIISDILTWGEPVSSIQLRAMN